MTAIREGYVAVLATNERGSVERRKAVLGDRRSRARAPLLDVAERREFNRGEVATVR